MSLACFIFSLFKVNVFFSVLKSWHTYAHSHPNGVQNGRIISLKNSHTF